MKIIKLTDQPGSIAYFVRHWGKWYALANDGSLVNIKGWFK